MPTLLTPSGTREGGIRCTYNRGIIDREEDWHYVVRADNLQQDRSDILYSTPGLPRIGLTVFNGMLCKAGDAQRNSDDGYRWEVNLTFTTSLDDNEGNQDPGGDPTQFVPVRQTLYEVVTEYSEFDFSGNPVANSAGVPYAERMPRKRYLPAWEFVQFDSISVTDDEILSRMEVTNSVIFKDKPIKTWLCRVLDSKVGFYGGFRCRATVYRLIYDFKKWTDKRADVGDHYKSAGKLVPWTSNGQVIMGPLNGSGGIAGTLDAPGTPSTREFDQYDALDFKTFLRI